MTGKHVSIEFPEWLHEAATEAARKQGIRFEDMVRLRAYEYVEAHLPERLATHLPTGEDVPVVVRMANAILANAIGQAAAEVRFVPRAGELSVTVLADGRTTEMERFPAHVRPTLYERFATLAARGGSPEAGIPMRSDGVDVNVRLEWDGDHGSEMALLFDRIAGAA
jgi:type II secretory ATPase GspE/PulE/Tfp pilus assembly ATPase PilB-like protein